MLANDRRSFALFCGILVIATVASPARAQSNGFNPYGNNGLPDYREFATPMYGNNPSLPGQARIDSERIGGGTRNNQFEAYSNSQRGRDSENDGTDPARGPVGAGVPYYRASRSPRPSDSVEGRKYADELKKRNEAYARARAETDPIKRSRLLRQLDQDALRRPLASSVDRPASTPVPKAAAKGARASAAPPSPFEAATGRRNASAPPPPTGGAPRPNQTPAPSRRPAAPAPDAARAPSTPPPATETTPAGSSPAPAQPPAGSAVPAAQPPAPSTIPPPR